MLPPGKSAGMYNLILKKTVPNFSYTVLFHRKKKKRKFQKSKENMSLKTYFFVI